MLGDTDDVYGVYDQCVRCLSGVQRLKNMLGDTDNVSATSVSQLCLDSGICWVTQMACLRSVR